MFRSKKPGSITWRRDSRGQAQVEFTLTIVFVLLLIFAIFELIMLVYTFNVVADSAKEGVRYAIVHGKNNTSPSGPSCTTNCTDINNVVQAYARLSFHDTSSMVVTTDYTGGGVNGTDALGKPLTCNDAPCAVRVTVSFPFKPLLGLGWPTVTVNAAAEGRIVY